MKTVKKTNKVMIVKEIKEELVSAEDTWKIKHLLKKVHGSYFKEMSFSQNILNFIRCSEWNHRWGRKYAMDDEHFKYLINQLNMVMGRNKNLLSYSMKLKFDIKKLKEEINQLKQNKS